MGILGILIFIFLSILVLPFLWATICFIFNTLLLTIGLVLSILGIKCIFSKQIEK